MSTLATLKWSPPLHRIEICFYWIARNLPQLNDRFLFEDSLRLIKICLLDCASTSASCLKSVDDYRNRP